MAALNDARFAHVPSAIEAGAPAVEQRERLGGWGGHVATEEQIRSNVAIRVAAELW